MSNTMRRFLAATATAAALWAGACAQEVGDIDRTQANKVKKSLFQGPGTTSRRSTRRRTRSASSPTRSSAPSRLRGGARQDRLAHPAGPPPRYKVTEFVQGADDRRVEAEGDAYVGEPIAAFKIVSHFDIQRDYNARTGEQTNVLVENTTDRPYYEREYMRVDWNDNAIASFNFLGTN